MECFREYSVGEICHLSRLALVTGGSNDVSGVVVSGRGRIQTPLHLTPKPVCYSHLATLCRKQRSMEAISTYS